MRKLAILALSTSLAAGKLSAATLYVSIESTNATAPYTNWATAATSLQAALDAAAPGDEVLVADGLYGPITAAKPLRLRSQNGPLFTLIDGLASGRCAWLTNGASLSGFRLRHGWADQGAGVFCASADVCLTNCIIRNNSAYNATNATGGWGGVYGGTLYNCDISFNSGAGAASSTLYDCTLSQNDERGAYGSSLSRCTLAGNLDGGAASCILSNCTLTGNSTSDVGAGASYSTLYNCTLSGNSSGSAGGGAASSTLYNCKLVGNTAAVKGGGGSTCNFYNCLILSNSATSTISGAGGGAHGGNLYNCLVAGNWAGDMGGGLAGAAHSYNCTVTANSALRVAGGLTTGFANNCIVYSNTAASSPNGPSGGTWTNCCTIPMPSSGSSNGNLTNEPLFVNFAAGDFRLQGTSPCRDAGRNDSVTGSTDLAGNPRIAGGTVDIGAYEFPGTNSAPFYAWLDGCGITADGTTDCQDADQDGLNNWQEWIAGTVPTNTSSAMRLVSAIPTQTSVVVRWQSVAGMKYFLDHSLDAASAFTRLATNLTGQAGETLYTHTNAAGSSHQFYRVGVNPP